MNATTRMRRAPVAIAAVLLVVFFLVLANWKWPVLRLRERSDHAFERIATLPLQHGRLAVYRTNGGATTSFGIAVRQELPLAPHLLLVRNLEGFYPAQHATITKLGERAVRITVPAYSDKAPVRSREYRLRRFVYF